MNVLNSAQLSIVEHCLQAKSFTLVEKLPWLPALLEKWLWTPLTSTWEILNPTGKISLPFWKAKCDSSSHLKFQFLIPPYRYLVLHRGTMAIKCKFNTFTRHSVLWKHHVNVLLQSFQSVSSDIVLIASDSIISSDEDQSLRIESFATINLRGVFTKPN